MDDRSAGCAQFACWRGWIAEARPVLYTTAGCARRLPPGGSGRIFGVVEGEMVSSDAANSGLVPGDSTISRKWPEDLAAIDPIHWGRRSNSRADLSRSACSGVSPLELRGLTDRRHGDMVLATHHQYGKVKVYYFARI
jgi:hypothetical protein